ncbi:GFA family protein [Pelagibius sp. CAU 1746]|uniref:GFA family protein n=1 Tax=Pelagibius sp. CAU 1746 TaxID=3140370 RepID=UPI00325B4ADC
MADSSEQKAWREGGCACGAVRYRARPAAALALYRCHCRDCQKQTSSAFGLSMFMPAEAFELTQGTPRKFARQADSGRIIDSFFCADCGSRIYNTSAARPGLVNLRPGTLDDPSGLTPVGDVWAARRQDWVDLLPGGVAYETQPDDLTALIERYAARKAARGGAPDASPEAGDAGS